MRRLLTLFGLLALVAAAGCGGGPTAATAPGPAFSAGPVGSGGSPPPPSPPPPRH